MKTNRYKAMSLALGLGISAAYSDIPDQAHPDWEVKTIPFPAKYKTMGMNFLPDGRMVLATTEFIGGGEVPENRDTAHKLLLVSGATGANPNPNVTVIANNWLQLAGSVVANGKIYVSDRDGFYEILSLTPPADLKANRKLVVKWPDEGTWPYKFQWHQFVFTPVYKGGAFYAPYSGSIRPGGPSDVNPTSKMTGAYLKFDVTGKIEAWAGGLRSPNGAGLDEASGDMAVADNQGSWLPASTFAIMKQGKFFGHRNISAKNTQANWAETLPYEPPVAWLQHGALRASPSEPIAIKTGIFAGHWLLGDINNPGLVRIFVDKVDANSTDNGAVFWFSKGFGTSAINRMAWGPDGALYVATCQAIAGNWPGGDKKDIYRVAPKTVAAAQFEMKAVRAIKDGLEIEYTQPVDPASAVKANYSARKAQYVRQEGYGAGKSGDTTLTITETQVSNDGKRVYVKIAAGLVADRVILLRNIGVKAADGKAIWNDNVYFTLNTLSNRAWDAAVGVRPEVQAALEAKVGTAMSASSLDVSLASEGPWQAALVAADGRLVDRTQGSGPSRFSLAKGSRSGLHFLRVTTREGQVLRKVLF